jgi:hypothetical protein
MVPADTKLNVSFTTKRGKQADEPSPAQGMLHSVWGMANPDPGMDKDAVPPISFPQKHSFPQERPASL